MSDATREWGALVVIWLIVCLSPVAEMLESDIRLHMLVEIPMLAIVGYRMGYLLYAQWGHATANVSHAALVLTAVVVSLYWMVPKSLDYSLNSQYMALAKYVSVTFLIGVPLGYSWDKISFIFRGVVIVEFLAMLCRLGWLYRESPVRLCSNYGMLEQISLGNYLLLIALMLTVYWTVKVFALPKTYVNHEKSKL